MIMQIENQPLSTYIITNDLSIQLIEIPNTENYPKCNYCGKGYHWNKSYTRKSYHWNKIWPPSLALSRYLAEEFSLDLLKGCRALVIGCGMGLEGMVLSKLGVSVTFLDHIQDALHAVSQNCLLNEIESFQTICCCWQDSNNVQSIGKYDLVIGSDILYYSDGWIWIKSLLENTLKTKGLALFSDAMRSNEMDFFSDLAKTGFQVKWADPRWSSGNEMILIFCVERTLAGSKQ